MLALLGEESLLACKKRNEPEKSIGVFWVGHHIVSVEPFEGDLLVRVTAVFPPQFETEIEDRVRDAALMEYGYYHLSTRVMGGYVLAEIVAYGVPCSDRSALQREVELICCKLDSVCGT